MKKKIFVVALAACLLILSVAGSSIAYFTDTAEYTNVFTAGNVNITLTANGQDASTAADILGEEDQNVYPGKTVDNEVVISNVGTEDAYVGAVITLTNKDGKVIGNILDDAQAGSNKIPVLIGEFLANLVKTSDGYQINVVETKNADDKVTGYTLYIVKEAPLAGSRTVANDANAVKAATLFTDVAFPTTWDNDEMASVNGLQVNVKAYAVQTSGFTGTQPAIDAILAAFGTDWAGSGFTATTNP